MPFPIARRECGNILKHLKPGGRWIELVYPKERWERDLRPVFEHWGKMTDGDRTPWAEWYDAEKLCRRLSPATFRVVLDFCFRDNNFRWLDLERL